MFFNRSPVSSRPTWPNLGAPAKPAATVEFIHTATLLHDDVVDESKQRRGRTTAKSPATSGDPVPPEISCHSADYIRHRCAGFEQMIFSGPSVTGHHDDTGNR